MTQSSQIPVAIIGIDCIFAKSQDKKAFYHLLSKNDSGITDPPDSYQHLKECYNPDPKKPDHIYCNRGGYLPTVKFDPTEFSIPPNVIEATDTSQLLSLVTAKKALDDAGYGENGKPFDHSKASVILGVTGTQELVIPLGARMGHPIWRRALKNSGVPEDQANEVIQRIGEDYVTWQENSFPGLLGNVVAGRIANRFDLGGTNCVVDAACASSMGAIHMALLELRSHRSDMVITGGVDTINDAFMHMCFSKTQILSASGDIRPFSKDADGTVLGEGIGLVVLKRLEDAERDGDRIYAVIRGLGSSSDGKSQSIYAPRPEGQAKALQRAYEEAGVDPDSVSLVEAHGTGTKVGDEVEFKTLCKVFGQVSSNGNRCALGSVKSNIGHTKAAAGAAGLIKAALSIYHKVLLPTCNAENADPKLGVEHSPFYLNTQLRPWLSQKGHNRRAGISAFGFGGSNFHTVIEEHSSDKLEPSWDGSVEIAAFSGSDEISVIEQIKTWAEEAIQNATAQNIGKLAKRSRKKFQFNDPLRLVMVFDIGEDMSIIGRICDDAKERLSGKKPSGNHSIYIGRGNPNGKLAFLFPGQGSQYVGMGKDLVCCLPESLNAFQAASGYLDDKNTLDEYVYPRIISDAKGMEDKLRQTQIAQPAIGAVSVAMLNALSAFGLKPDATCGHSYGELVALHAAGWMGLKDLWNLSVQRGRLMAQAGRSAGESGTMLAVKAPIHEIDEWVQDLEGQVVLANRNSLDQAVLSGTDAGIDAAEAACKEKGWRTVRLPVAAAFHSPLVADAQKPFSDCVQSVSFNPNSTLVMSNTLGDRYPTSIENIRTTLGKQLACPVDFVSNVHALYEKGVRTFVEVGPKSVLTKLVRATVDDTAVTTIAMDQSMGRESGIKDLAATLSQLAALGFSIKLDHWEKPQSPIRKKRMAIDLSGANFRNPRAPKKASVAQPKKALVHHTQNKGHDLSDKSNNPDAGQHHTEQKRSISNNPPTPARTCATQPNVDRQENKMVEQALTTVQQGMASIQALQSQTVQAHQKFLETQAEASKTLQQMMQSAQQLSMNMAGDHIPTVPMASQKINNPLPVEMAPISAAPSPRHEVKASAPVDKPLVPAKAQNPKLPNIQSTNSKKVDLKDSVESKLLDIVSELTGYPVEMLGTEMDIESDLGIDSIKRVEILSALEEKMPDLPKVTPDMMGSLKTLGQICDFLSASTESAQPVQSLASPPPPGAAADDVQEIQQTLIDIVSELTGYPAEMLGAEMDIESDLGIDSIKRVEILSALEEKMPHLPKVTPDMMGSLKTLGQICDFLSASTESAQPVQSLASPPSPGAAADDVQEIQQTLIDIVSELTGYPAEMLGAEMDIESDLGIDSIKRVEILSALEEKMPHLPKVTPDMMGSLKTLGQICDFLSASTESAQPVQSLASPPPPGAAADDVQEIQQTLIDIVSELTGYPAEMLGAEMDIESDLGIDSIKRVEILSALEEKMPHLPKVTPDMMGSLKTLGQICDFLSASTESAQPVQSLASPPSPGAAADDVQEIQQTLIDIVSELTGYPAEMLGAEMDIESDLGIDSIKRVEILSALEEKMPHLPKVTPDMMGTLKTLGQIIVYLGKVPEIKPSEPEDHPQAKIHVVQSPADEKIDRQIIKIQAMEKPSGSAIEFPGDHFIGVVGSLNGLVVELITALKNNGVVARHLKHFDEITPDMLLAGLILVAPMESIEAFRWAKAGAPRLQKTAQHTNACFATISAMDGAFGFSGRPIDDPSQGALAGLAKTARIEWPGVNCKAMDIDPGWEDLPAVAQAICESILFTEPKASVEIGLSPHGRIGLSLETVKTDENRTIDLTRKDVVIVTGGARGVTAAASRALASHTPCTLVLMGRSPAPQPEPQWLAPLSNEADIKKAILGQHSHQAKISPKKVEHIYQKWMANRQVLATLSDLQRMGADAHYISTDVRDYDAIHAQLEKIRREMGPIRALIHGAGVLEDRFIVDKQAEQFSQVYDTKVKGLICLLNATMDDDLKYIVLFSSVSARMGNQGQVDYAMANEVLNKTAWQQSHIRPVCKVISINWGPWDGGMVTPSLKRNFIKNNIALIPIDVGARAMVSEMAQPINDAVEIVLGGPLPKRIATDKAVEKPVTPMTLTCKRDVSLDRYPVLHSHQLDGRPVVPLALITEWLAHSALHSNPGLFLHGLDNLRLLNGIILDRKKRLIQLLAGKAQRNGSVYNVAVEIRDGMKEGLDRVHSSASAVLSEVLPEAPAFNENGHFNPANDTRCLDDIYRNILFHGQDLQGITEIIRISDDGISAKLATAPPPAQWINDPLRSRWIADPLVLDSAFQMAIVWCHKHYGLVSLPSFAAAYRQYCHRFPDTGVSAVLEIQKRNHRKMVGNFTFLDKDRKVLASLKGYEAIMDPSLSKAFKAA